MCAANLDNDEEHAASPELAAGGTELHPAPITDHITTLMTTAAMVKLATTAPRLQLEDRDNDGSDIDDDCDSKTTTTTAAALTRDTLPTHPSYLPTTPTTTTTTAAAADNDNDSRDTDEGHAADAPELFVRDPYHDNDNGGGGRQSIRQRNLESCVLANHDDCDSITTTTTATTRSRSACTANNCGHKDSGDDDRANS
ncbi:hypothetical protein EDB85DRAFT_2147702 [Lactarius pseudohatsudake]|nr:hypothetical protein EDB85DRAFT_2147702 [Lactarius pseudohatsudake]